MKNKIIAHLTIILIMMGVFCNVCTTYNRISVFDNSVYAEADNWSACDSSDLVTAFRYYCKSRNLALDGSVADALTTFTSTTFNNICSTLGIDPTTLQAELKKTTDDNIGLRFLFSNTGITAYNRIFAEFLQNNDFSVGDSVDNEIIFSGELFTDNNGNTCYVYSTNNTASNYSNDSKTDLELKNGTIYHFDSFSQFVNIYKTNANQFYSLNVSAGSTDYTYSFYNAYSSTGAGVLIYINNRVQGSATSTFEYYKNVRGTDNISSEGWPCIWKDRNGYYFGCYGEYPNTDNTNFKGIKYKKITGGSSVPADVTVNTPNNTVINNNTYNNNYVIIYNGGDTYISDDDDEPLPTTPPSGGGGGGGGDNPDNPDIPPVDPTPTPNPTIPDWDIELPEMPTGNDWLLYGLEKKFPWDIPFNLMYMLSLFAADPETPHFEGTLDLKIVQWDYDIDLAPFDEIAGYVRNIEFIGFLIGLMLLTNKLIWG